MTTRFRNDLRFTRFGNLCRFAAALGLTLAVAACSSDGGDDGDDGEDGSGGTTSGTGGSTQGSGGTTAGTGGGTTAGSGGGTTAGSGGGSSCVSCDDGCPNIPCVCNDGGVVNTTYCDNGCCAPAEVACPDACSDYGGWNTGSGGGSTGGSGGSDPGGSGGGSSGNDIGGECQYDEDCLSQICLFKVGAAYGYCSQMCESFADCPSFWDCEPVGNASGTYCVQDD